MAEQEMRVDCAVQFSRLTTALENTHESLDNVTKSIDRLESRTGQLEVRMGEVDSSTRGAWHELQDISTELRRVPDVLRANLRDHKDDCVVRTNATQQQVADQLPKPNRELIKWIIYIGLMLGSVGVGAVGGISLRSDADASAKVSK